MIYSNNYSRNIVHIYRNFKIMNCITVVLVKKTLPTRPKMCTVLHSDPVWDAGLEQVIIV